MRFMGGHWREVAAHQPLLSGLLEASLNAGLNVAQLCTGRPHSSVFQTRRAGGCSAGRAALSFALLFLHPEPHTVGYSQSSLIHLVGPSDCTLLGFVHGGERCRCGPSLGRERRLRAPCVSRCFWDAGSASKGVQAPSHRLHGLASLQLRQKRSCFFFYA